MGAVHNKIKKLRTQSGMTQQDIADKLNIHLKTWQKIENGFTKLDLERLKEIAALLETTVEELINVDDNVYINEITGNDVGFNNSEINITHNHCSENEKALYERMLKEKDEQIVLLKDIIEKFKIR